MIKIRTFIKKRIEKLTKIENKDNGILIRMLLGLGIIALDIFVAKITFGPNILGKTIAWIGALTGLYFMIEALILHELRFVDKIKFNKEGNHDIDIKLGFK